MRNLFLSVLLLVVCGVARGQRMSDEYRILDFPYDDFHEIVSDTTLFYAPLGDGVSVYERLTRYNMGFVSFRDRGYPASWDGVYLGTLDLSSGDKYPDYTFLSALREGTADFSESRDRTEGVAGTIRYDLSASAMRDGQHISLHYSDRRYRGTVKFSSGGPVGQKWRYGIKGIRRWGTDAFIDGVFTDEATLSLMFERQLRDTRRLSFFAVASPSQRGGKGWTTAEVFELTGNPYYNPSWGWYNGNVRNTKVYSDFTPMVAISYDFGNVGGRRYNVSAGWRTGECSSSGLSWFDARNPAADYYMNLPSYFTDSEKAGMVAEAWLSGDSDYTQMNWQRLVEANAYRDGAAYVMDDRVERLNNFQAAFGVASENGRRLRYDWGVRLRHDRGNHFKRLKDLLGGTHILNVDQYLLDDQFFGDKIQNDLRNPNRIVREGDRYGYDYDIIHSSATLHGRLHFRERRLHIRAGGQLSSGWLHRNGHYEKETFPGGDSFGRSARHEFTTYRLNGEAQYFFTPLHNVALSVHAAEREPHWQNIFVAPESNNHTISPVNLLTYGAELRYAFPVTAAASFELAAYCNATANETEIYRYYDDLYAEYTADNLPGYSIAAVSGIARCNRGVEAALRVDIVPRLSLYAAGSVNGYTFRRNADIVIVADVNLQERLTGAQCYIDGYVANASPQNVAAISLSYATLSQWSVEAGWYFAGQRYVSLNPVRRTSRIIALAPSPEMRGELLAQERLPDASTLNVRLSKSISFRYGRLYLNFAVNNLLNRTGVIYGGYEQMRIRKSGTGVNRNYSPFPTRYAHAYPRTVNAMISCNF